MLDYTKADWIKRAAGLILRSESFLNGIVVDATSGGEFQSIGSAADAILTDVGACDLEEVGLLDCLRMGNLVTDAATLDAPRSAHFFQFYAEAIDKIFDEVAPTCPGDLAIVARVPLGVIGAGTLWNSALDMATLKAAAGHSVILKPAGQSPRSALRLAERAVDAGLPGGVFALVPGFDHTAGRALGVDSPAFAGATVIGKKFME